MWAIEEDHHGQSDLIVTTLEHLGISDGERIRNATADVARRLLAENPSFREMPDVATAFGVACGFMIGVQAQRLSDQQ